MELIKYYELVIEYHLGKANVVTDALSWKSPTTLAHIRTAYMPLLIDMRTLGLNLDYDSHGALLASFVVKPSLVDQIRRKEMQYERFVKEVHKIMNGEIGENFNITQDGVLTLRGRVCVPNVDDLRKLIMEEAHCSAYAMHPGSTKMYHTIKENYWWLGMKRDIANFVSKCLVCQQLKAEHQRPSGTFQPLSFLEWKCEHITMDFVIGLPCTQVGYNAIWVIMNRLTKLAHL